MIVQKWNTLDFGVINQINYSFEFDVIEQLNY